jgi:limonene-1,2-epoxide hydrolase
VNLPTHVAALLHAVAARDADAVGACFTPEAIYHFSMPSDPVCGQSKIAAVFATILGECTRVEWEIVASTVEPQRVWLERVDRFWFSDAPGTAVPIECVGIVDLAADGRIAAVRDYCDMSVWRERRAAVE